MVLGQLRKVINDLRTRHPRSQVVQYVVDRYARPDETRLTAPNQVIDVFPSPRRNLRAARTFFSRALDAHEEPDEVVTDLAQALETVIEELIPDAFHNTEQYANNRIECDHGRLKSRLRPMRGLKTDRTASVVIRGHAFIQNLRRGHYELGAEPRHHHLRVVAAFDELIDTI